jgi:hypothetical protein
MECISADPARPQLGELLVHKGVLTETQLEHALAEQRQSGAPLGEILVRLGFSKGATIANALADQHGGPLRTEYGLSIGPTHPVGTPPDPTRSLAPVPDPDPGPSEQDAVIARLTAALDEKRLELARVHADLASAAGQVAAATAELARIRREAEPAPEAEHLLFLPGAKGYRILPRSGAAPEVGVVVEVALDGGASVPLTVMKIGASPLPGTRVRCVYLA